MADMYKVCSQYLWNVDKLLPDYTALNLEDNQPSSNPEDNHLQTRRRENLKSYIINDAYIYILQPFSFKTYSVKIIIYVIKII
jgi:hypothetical protein